MLTSDIFSEDDANDDSIVDVTTSHLMKDIVGPIVGDPSVAPTDSSARLKERQAWIKSIRIAFCKRPDSPDTHNMIHSDGTLNQEYFRPSKEAILTKPVGRTWTDKERGLLIQGIKEFGIGHFREISEKYLPDWSANDLRVKTMRLVGRQNLQLYKDWKGTEEHIAKEYERNKEIGLSLGYWKNGVLIYDEQGKVLEAIMKGQVT